MTVRSNCLLGAWHNVDTRLLAVLAHQRYQLVVSWRIGWHNTTVDLAAFNEMRQQGILVFEQPMPRRLLIGEVVVLAIEIEDGRRTIRRNFEPSP